MGKTLAARLKERAVCLFLLFVFAAISAFGIFRAPESSFASEGVPPQSAAQEDALLPDDDGQLFRSSLALPPPVTYEDVVTFTTVQDNRYIVDFGFPGLSSPYSCGITAGGEIITWFQKQFPILIPGHTAGYYSPGGNWIWYGAGVHVQIMYDDLREEMNEALTGSVTVTNYVNGLKNYIIDHRRAPTSARMMTGGQLNMTNVKADLHDGRLLSIFCDDFELINVLEYPGYDIVAVTEHFDAHVMAVYGYREIEYFNAYGTSVRKDIYLEVNTGIMGQLGLLRVGHYSVGGFTTVVDCYSMKITM